jgi:hypothetical protein
MITPNDIKIKAEKKYLSFLRSILDGNSFFPVEITGNKKPSQNIADYQSEISTLTAASKEIKGYGYSLKYQTVRTRSLGNQDLPVTIYFETEKDFLKFIKKEKEVETFRNDVDKILFRFPELSDWLKKYPQKIIENAALWDSLLSVCSYFKTTPKPNLYIRELPVKVHSKFIQNNKGVISELLNNILPSENINQEYTNTKDFEKRFNLKYPEPLVRFRIFDKQINETYFSGINDISIPVTQFEQLQIPVENILIVENQTNLLTIALTFPKLEKTIVVFGSGYQVHYLKNVLWFNNMKLLYWGDLDAQGFEILSQFRGYFPNTQSILMDEETFNEFFEHDSGTPTKITGKLNLTNNEMQLYDLLKTNNWRLEQEKIPLTYVKKWLNNYGFCSFFL